ncbi:type II toxin-antitoxin system HipA family toxin [Actinobacteria bacterium YIM 96077]|uniref:Type II toxin-antitoxin system HipA family toxin n=1 Tax=Phytoactinopolyspora halophila TaxID=1981511 RepID=A0A329QVS9_9ACTN|nr:type II toxin-antitoxin system HipA family toxin [Phytoactinopolyspora halophila]AYY14955.1 type II toxin-antitoxin system HipA family toxin [Actinobacteria bacterium YIM 96077]RAW15412.1 type II toxin-antitoxin system HipA family toxin [Phytoactinopolyspora halophila]
MAERRLAVYLDGTPVGTLTQSTTGRVDFNYLAEYNDPSSVPLSLSLPLGRTTFPPKAVNAFLAGLLPDSESTLERWGRQFGVSPRNPFALLAHVGRDAAGAVQVLPEDEASTDAASRHGDIEWLATNDIDGILDEIAAHRSDWNPGRHTGRWSLAGAQSKVALFRGDDGRWGIPRDSTPTTHILKPSIPGLEHHHLNEHLCLRAAQLVGLPAAETEIITHGATEVLISRRYDRVFVDGRWRRIHQEDLCQALAVHPHMKYQSDGGPGVAEIAQLLRGLVARDRQASAKRFFDALAFNVLIGATDAHAKNYSLLLASNSRTQLGPLYDVATIVPYEQQLGAKSAMKIGSTWLLHKVSESDWATVATRLGLSVEESLERVATLRAAIPDAFHRAAHEDAVPGALKERATWISELVTAHIEDRRGAFGVLKP